MGLKEVKRGQPDFFWVTNHRSEARGPFVGTFPEKWRCSLLSCQQGWVLTSGEAPSKRNVTLYRPLLCGCHLYNMGDTYTKKLFVWNSNLAGALSFYLLNLVTLLLDQTFFKKWSQGRKLKKIWSKLGTINRSYILGSAWLGENTPYLGLMSLTAFLKVFIYVLLVALATIKRQMLNGSVHGLLLVAASRDHSLLQCTGFSLRWLLLSQSTSSRLMGFSSWTHGLRSGSQA